MKATTHANGCLTRLLSIVTLVLALSAPKEGKAQAVTVVETVAALEALDASHFTNDTVALVIDYYASSQNRGRGGGHFRWLTNVPSANYPATIPDGGRYIACNTYSNGIWERMLEGETPNVKMWGAVGDGVQNDYVALTNAINGCEGWGVGELLFPRGGYLVNNSLVFNSANLHIRGETPVTTFVYMQSNAQADIFRTYNADQAYHCTTNVWFDDGLVFENIGLGFLGTNLTNSGLVVCQPGEATSIRNIIVTDAGIGIRCLGPGDAGLRLRDVRMVDCTIAAVSVEGFTNCANNQFIYDGDDVSIIGLSADEFRADADGTAALIRFQNCICGGEIRSLKAEGAFGGGIIQCTYPNYTVAGWNPMAHLIVDKAECSCAYGGVITDFIQLRGGSGFLGRSGPAFTLNGINLYYMPILIDDQVTGRKVESDYASDAQATTRIPVSYESRYDGGQGIYSTLTIGQTAIATLYATNAGWYRVMQPLGYQPLHLAGNLVISSPNYESTEIQVDANPAGGDAWLSVTRCPVKYSNVPLVTQARAYTYWDNTLGGPWAAVDLYFPSNNNPRITLSTDIHGDHGTGDEHTILMGLPLPETNSLTGVTPTVVNTYR